jgi:hypothetical protein
MQNWRRDQNVIVENFPRSHSTLRLSDDVDQPVEKIVVGRSVLVKMVLVSLRPHTRFFTEELNPSLASGKTALFSSKQSSSGIIETGSIAHIAKTRKIGIRNHGKKPKKTNQEERIGF